MKTIPIYTNDGVVQVDDADYDRIATYSWFSKGRGYATTNVRVGTAKYKQVILHHLILDIPEGHRVIFRDGNGLNCQRENLLIVPRREACKWARRHRR